VRKFVSIIIASLVTYCAATAFPVFADEAKPVVADPVLEQHVKAITEELRCLVCQNQTIADSHADLAIDLRNQVREKVKQGMSDKDILDYMVQRYGDFVLYRPPVKSTTWLLWFGPFLLLLGGLAILMWRLRRGATVDEPVSESDLQRAAALLRTSPENTKE
jgi:cytochrome c-type biogenesis protein CcmH